MATIINKQKVVTGLFNLGKGHRPEAMPERPVLEQFIYAVCREDATRAADAAAAPDVPALHVWDAAPPSTEAPGRDAYALRLVAGRTLYDRSRVVVETPVLGGLHHAYRRVS